MVGLFSHRVMKTFSEANKILLVVAELVELLDIRRNVLVNRIQDVSAKLPV